MHDIWMGNYFFHPMALHQHPPQTSDLPLTHRNTRGVLTTVSQQENALATESIASFRACIDTLLADTSDSTIHQRKAAHLSLQGLRLGDEDLLSRMEEYVRDENKSTGAGCKLLRFICAAYFTERLWQYHERKRDESATPTCINDVQLKADLDELFDPLDNDVCHTFDGRLHRVHKEVAGVFFSPKGHIGAGIDTGTFFSKEFLRIVYPIYLRYLREQEQRGSLVESDQEVLGELGNGVIHLIEKFSSVGFPTFQQGIHRGGGGPPVNSSRISQNPDNYVLTKKNGKFAIEMQPTLLARIGAMQAHTEIGCPAMYARSTRGVTVVRALCEEVHEHWQLHALPLLFRGDQHWRFANYANALYRL